jgi:hypothetical protein
MLRASTLRAVGAELASAAVVAVHGAIDTVATGTRGPGAVGEFDFFGSVFLDEWTCQAASYRWAVFSGAEFRGAVAFDRRRFGDRVELAHTRFTTVPAFRATEFMGDVVFDRVEFPDGADITAAVFGGEVDFSHSRWAV